MLNEFILLQAAAQSLNDYWGMIVVIVVFVVIGLILKLKNLFKTNEKDNALDQVIVDPPIFNSEHLASGSEEKGIVVQPKNISLIISNQIVTGASGSDSNDIDIIEDVETNVEDDLVSSSSFPEDMSILVSERGQLDKKGEIKYIGYNPINVFSQTEPLNYPYVIMPKSGSVIKFPRKGRIGRKGYKEEQFKCYLQSYLEGCFQIYDDRFILTRNNSIRYEPDFTLIDERDGINIFLDIEIDEPYEGMNDITQRNATHYQYSDTKRNNEFKSRGWIVIRFAEIQVHQNPLGCCRFIADVIKSINSNFVYPEGLAKVDIVTPVRQWTKVLALEWSAQKYREQYLGIDKFGTTFDNVAIEEVKPTVEDVLVEEAVIDEKDILIHTMQLSKSDIMFKAINSGKYISFMYHNDKTVVKPIRLSNSTLIAFCYVKNIERQFVIADITDISIKDSYYTLRLYSPNLGVKKVAEIMNIVIPNQMYVRMKYTRGEWVNMIIDPGTGEVIMDKTEAETSIRTVSNISLDTEGYGSNYIKTYCHRREEERIFRFDRISELEILDL